MVLIIYIWNCIVYFIADPFYINKYSFYSAITSFFKSLNIYVIWFLKLSQLKKMYFVFRLVVVALFIWYSVKYGLNHSNALPNRNIPIYITASTSIAILCPLYCSLSDIYIRYPLSFAFILLNHLTANSLTFLIFILFSLLLKAS